MVPGEKNLQNGENKTILKANLLESPGYSSFHGTLVCAFSPLNMHMLPDIHILLVIVQSSHTFIYP